MSPRSNSKEQVVCSFFINEFKSLVALPFVPPPPVFPYLLLYFISRVSIYVYIISFLLHTYTRTLYAHASYVVLCMNAASGGVHMYLCSHVSLSLPFYFSLFLSPIFSVLSFYQRLLLVLLILADRKQVSLCQKLEAVYVYISTRGRKFLNVSFFPFRLLQSATHLPYIYTYTRHTNIHFVYTDLDSFFLAFSRVQCTLASPREEEEEERGKRQREEEKKAERKKEKKIAQLFLVAMSFGTHRRVRSRAILSQRHALLIIYTTIRLRMNRVHTHSLYIIKSNTEVVFAQTIVARCLLAVTLLTACHALFWLPLSFYSQYHNQLSCKHEKRRRGHSFMEETRK